MGAYWDFLGSQTQVISLFVLLPKIRTSHFRRGILGKSGECHFRVSFHFLCFEPNSGHSFGFVCIVCESAVPVALKVLLGRSWVPLGVSWELLVLSWVALGLLLGAAWELLGALGGLLGRSWVPLGVSWRLLVRSWVALWLLLGASWALRSSLNLLCRPHAADYEPPG